MYLHKCVYCGVEFQTLFEGPEEYCMPEHREKHSLLDDEDERSRPTTTHLTREG
jgi:hypothetical protein